jgi:DNA-binding MarR family transcriptional regulator
VSDEQDAVDEFIEHLARLPEEVRPDPEVEALVGRLHAASRQFRRRVERSLSEQRLAQSDLQIMTWLRLMDGLQSSPGAIARGVWLTPGAITNRLDRLEALGFVRRRRGESDRRAVVVELTDSGLRFWDALIGEHGRDEARIAGVLTKEEQQQLNGLLRKLLRGLREDI